MSGGTNAILGALFTAFSSFGGSYLAVHWQSDLWRKEKLYTMNMTIFDRRIETINVLARAFADVQRFAIVHQATSDSSANTLSAMIYCSDLANGRSDTPICRNLKPSPQDLGEFNEFNELTARYQSAALATQIYFCNKTKNAINELPSGGYWWNVDEETKASIIEAMRSELFCAIKFADLELR